MNTRGWTMAGGRVAADQVARRLLGEALVRPMRLAAAIGSAVALGAVQLYLTWLLKRWVEGPVASGDMRTLAPLLVQGVATMAVGMAALFLSRYLVASIDQHVVERLRNRAVGRLLALDLARARSFQTGDLMARVLTDAGAVAAYLGTIGRRVIREIIVTAGALVMLFVLEWRLALATCTLVPLTAYLLDRLGRVIRSWASAAQKDVGILGGILDEQLHGLTTIKGFQAEAFELDRFARRSRAIRQHLLRSELWSGVLLAVVFLLTGIGFLAIVWYGTQQISARHLGNGVLLAFVLYAGQIVEPLRRLSELQGSQQVVLSSASRLYEIIDLPIADVPGGETLAAPADGGIDFDAVTFGYRPGTPVLDRVSLSIPARSRVALVGGTGVGKSTIAGLLVRFIAPTSGSILLDGRPIAGLSLPALRRAICTVEQDPFVFSGPLIDNIRYGSWDAERETVRAAVRMAGLDGLVDRLPGGLDAPLVEAGRHLSGGEKQRIALARAIVRDPAVLVLDEATSAIDSETETAVFAGLEAWLARRTVVLISHRLATVLHFPRLVMLDAGRVIADGPPAEVLRDCPACAALFADQATPLQP